MTRRTSRRLGPAAHNDAQYALPGTLARRAPLTQEQAQRYPPWFDNAHRLRDVIADLEARSMRAFHDADG